MLLLTLTHMPTLFLLIWSTLITATSLLQGKAVSPSFIRWSGAASLVGAALLAFLLR